MDERKIKKRLPVDQRIKEYTNGESIRLSIMIMSTEIPHRNYLITIITCRCPRCREGKLFKYPLTFRFNKNMEMNESCPVCGQVTDIEVGFYYGTGYVSYLVALLLTVISFNSLSLLLLQPWLMRFARSLWLSCFVSYDPEWPDHKPDDPERVIKEQM